ncbi:MAG TPA: MauE/DoxX family redox-associated membrane protein [Ktedonobacteraceae bacterium]
MIQGILLVIVILIRTALAAVLIAAGAAKLAGTRSFATTIMGLGVPARRKLLIRGLALIIPLLELGLGIALVSGLWPVVVNSAVLVLMTGFSLIVIVALRRKLQVACRCFGTLSDSQFTSKGLARSLLLTVLAAVIFWSGNTYSLRFDGPSWAIMLLVAGFLLFALAAAQAAKTIALLKEGAA